ncbi:GspE/PulE family protein [Clostridium sp. MT-14]|jgi:type IV pilus assembly protein PilB
MFSTEMKEVNIDEILLEPDIVKRIPEEIARDNCVIALKRADEQIIIAADKTPDINLVEELKFILGVELRFVKADRRKIYDLINTYYCRENLHHALKDIKMNKNTSQMTGENISDIHKFQSSPVVKAANYIINKAIDERASDLHIEPFQKSVTIRMRVDGIIYEYIKIPRNIYPLLCTRIKIMAQMDIAEKRLPQDGKIKYTKGNFNYDIRVSTLPTIYGEKVVLRILYRDTEIKNLNMLGFLKEDETKIKNMLNRSSGLILVTGPTGSGKTTTVYSMVSNINAREKNIVSIEDPVEYTLDDVNQVNVNSKIGLDFARGLRSILRQDPDVIMLGEIRDEETAHMAIRAAVTGHLVISTLHTNNSAESAIRLKDMGIPEYFIRDALVGIISQRLVRKICPYCKTEYQASPEEIVKLNLSSEQVLYKGKGCDRCNHKAYKGRTVIYDISYVNDYMRGFSKNSVLNVENSIEESRGATMKENCMELVKSGVTTYEEFLRMCL